MKKNEAARRWARVQLDRTARKASLLRRIRPTSFASAALGIISKRHIVELDGMRLYIDPVSHLGATILSTGAYEPETAQLFRENVKRGDCVLDIGANEGVFSVLAAHLVGPDGTVIAVEPQSRLQDIVEINFALAPDCRKEVVQCIVGDIADDTAEISLFPVSNTGSSSAAKAYRFSAASEVVPTTTPEAIAEALKVDRFDFVKVDVEGYEPEVVRGLMPMLTSKRVGKLLLDYHRKILDHRGIDPLPIHQSILDQGYTAKAGTPDYGYVLYGAP